MVPLDYRRVDGNMVNRHLFDRARLGVVAKAFRT